MQINNTEVTSIEQAKALITSDVVYVNDSDDDQPYEAAFFVAALEEVNGEFLPTGCFYTYTASEWQDEQESETRNEILESEYQDAIQNGTVREWESDSDFENWAQNDWGFCEYDGTSYAKVDERDADGDVETFKRDDAARTWSRAS